MVDDQVTPIGPLMPPDPNEAGWKDTVRTNPDEITRVIARFEDYTGRYPYHCHILEHEDHEMMRQFEVHPACPGDIAPAGGDDAVNVSDLLMVINSWGACPAPPESCPADVTGDEVVNTSDLLAVINGWGTCP
jgi:spore coat protein A